MQKIDRRRKVTFHGELARHDQVCDRDMMAY
jgi:hypothetical protein